MRVLLIVRPLVAFIHLFTIIVIIMSLLIYLLNINIYLKSTYLFIFIYVDVNDLLCLHIFKILTDWLIDWLIDMPKVAFI